MKKHILFLFLFLGLITHAQVVSKNFRTKIIHPESDTIRIDSISIYPYNFKVFDVHQQEINNTNYSTDFVKAMLIINKNYESILVQYYVFPSFLTSTYINLDKKIIAPFVTQNPELYTFEKKDNSIQKPFEGLKTSGSLIRGITVGNNQNSVLNSSLDLQISGKLSENITLKAAISDTSVPIQQNGYTQNLQQFDNVYIELDSKQWQLKAGDIFIKNISTELLNFNKKVSGVELNTQFKLDNTSLKTSVSGAIVQGKFVSNQFKGQNGNQGPYKLKGNQGESFIIVVPGSETIFINGSPLKSGAENDYTIDYQTAEITFNPTFPINSDLRITVEFQFNELNYNRFITYNTSSLKKENWQIGAYYYRESDLKNQPIQNDLNREQLFILTDAGNDVSKMIAHSATLSNFDETKILYRKINQGNGEIYEFSTNSSDILYQVNFSFVGINKGSYRLKNTIAFGKIFEFVGQNLGNYEPIIQLKAPNLLEIIALNGHFKPSEKTELSAEVALSNRDLNLFSSIDDNQNKGLASKLQWNQTLIDKSWKLKSNLSYKIVQKQFTSVEKINPIEFSREWNLETFNQNQQFLKGLLTLSNNQFGNASYGIEKLTYGSQFYDGTRHSLQSNLNWKKLQLNTDYNFLDYNSISEKGSFIRLFSNLKYKHNNYWVGTSAETEKNHRKETVTNTFTPQSFEYNTSKIYTGFGAAEKSYVEIGYAKSKNDSIRNNNLTKVNDADTYYIKSQLINNQQSKISVYVHYRNNHLLNDKNEESLNSQIQYSQELFKGFFQLQSIYETLSGNVPQQEYTYLKTEPGNGYFTWNDYNQNGIQELNEFEIAKFKDEASYLRIALPNIYYLNTHQAKISQSLTFNPAQWQAKKGFQGFLSHFYNQSFLLIENKKLKNNNQFNWNPFDTSHPDLMGLTYHFKNSFYLNRGKNKYSTAYHFTEGKQKSLFLFEDLSNNTSTHQLQFTHRLNNFWLFELAGKTGNQERFSSTFLERNFKLNEKELQPKLTLTINQQSNADFFYSYAHKKNEIGLNEALKKQVLCVAFQFLNDKGQSVKSEFQFINNNFEGVENSAVAYQMLEGLRKGNNFTWLLLANQKLTDYLYLNLHYSGRKSEDSKAIHTGSVQLRLNF
ncbi:MAG: hypothetical protein Q8J84_10145 [Flavobacteriaceae bacterium]|nr:hypothetical protein [Flavobacteriaceae bacterium]